MTDPSMEREISEIRRIVEVGFASSSGKLDLVLHRLDQQDRRADAHEQRLDRLDERQDSVERDYVPRTELVREIATVRAEAGASKSRTLQVLSPLMAAVAIAVSIILPLATTTGKG